MANAMLSALQAMGVELDAFGDSAGTFDLNGRHDDETRRRAVGKS